MKPSYYRRRNAFFSSTGRVVAAFGVLLIVVMFLLRLLAPSTFFSLTAPLFSVGNSISQMTETKEDAQLREDRALLNETIALRERVRELTALLGDTPSERQGVVAGVIARPPLAPYDTIIVAAGETNGVSFGDLVSAEGGVPIGTIDMVSAQHAQVSLFSTAGRVTQGWVGEEHLPIALMGEGGGAFIAEVARDAEISEGALVYIPGPGARPVGTVVRVDADPSSPSATLRISPMVNIFSLTLVMIEDPS